MGEAKIVRAVIVLPEADTTLEAVFSSDGGQAVVTATFDSGEEGRVLSYYPDELTFTEEEFVGLTRQEPMDLFAKKDIAYLRS